MMKMRILRTLKICGHKVKVKILKTLSQAIRRGALSGYARQQENFRGLAMIRLYCKKCGKYCGKRDEILFRLERGAKVEISVTCRACANRVCRRTDRRCSDKQRRDAMR